MLGGREVSSLVRASGCHVATDRDKELDTLYTRVKVRNSFKSKRIIFL
jgi:hypothetical protein